jgi:hypothetical protein
MSREKVHFAIARAPYVIAFTMLLAKLTPTLVLSLAALPLAGCCCPLSGRYHNCCESQAACTPPGAAGVAAVAIADMKPLADAKPHGKGNGSGLHAEGALRHRGLLARFRGHPAGAPGDRGPVPSEQHADYLAPHPRFHPVPTRPVFEPQPAYPPPLLLDPPRNVHELL